MKYYFGYVLRQQKLKRILDSWLRTPFRHRCGVKGLGCDCIHFVARVLEEMEILEWRKNLIPDYPPDWHLHNTRSLLMERVEKEFKIERVSFDNPMNGDIMIYHIGKTAAHAGFYFDGLLYQSITDIGVQKVPWYDKEWFNRKKYNLRLLN